MKRHEISEEQWNRIKSLFPPERKLQGGRPGKGNREMLNATLILAKYRDSMTGFAGEIRTVAKCIQPVSSMDKSGRMGTYSVSPDRSGLGGGNNADAG